jgi:hypothetical protein
MRGEKGKHKCFGKCGKYHKKEEMIEVRYEDGKQSKFICIDCFKDYNPLHVNKTIIIPFLDNLVFKLGANEGNNINKLRSRLYD